MAKRRRVSVKLSRSKILIILLFKFLVFVAVLTAAGIGTLNHDELGLNVITSLLSLEGLL